MSGLKIAEGSMANGTANGRTSFSFGSWIRLHSVDLITMALMGALGLGIYEARKHKFTPISPA